MGLVAIVVASFWGATTIDGDTLNPYTCRFTLSKVEDDMGMELVDGYDQWCGGASKGT